MKETEVAIDVKAFGINRLDLEMIKRSNDIGVEVSGIITAVGELPQL